MPTADDENLLELLTETYSAAKEVYKKHGYSATREYLWDVPGITVNEAKLILEQIVWGAR